MYDSVGERIISEIPAISVGNDGAVGLGRGTGSGDIGAVCSVLRKPDLAAR